MAFLVSLLFIVILVSRSSCVDRSKFLTCQELDYCKELSSLKENVRRFKLVSGTQKCLSGLIEAQYENSEDVGPVKSRVKVSLMANGESIGRVLVTEVKPTFKRLEIFSDILAGIHPEPPVDFARPVKEVSTSSCAMEFMNGVSVVFQFEPLLIATKVAGQTYISLNENGLLQLESHLDADRKRILNQTTEGNFTVPQGRRAVSLDVTFHNFAELYGVPEHTDSFAIDTKNKEPYRLFNLDVFEYELNERMSLYGSVPFLHAHSGPMSMGVFWNNPSETWLQFRGHSLKQYLPFVAADSKKRAQFVSETGVVDVFLMFGPTPMAVSKQFASLVGFQQLPPLSSLGYHQCRWNCLSQDETTEIIDKFDQYHLPMDYVWLDIEHTQSKNYLTWNPVTFPNPDGMLKHITSKGRRLVVIVDPHIAKRSTYYVYNEALEKDFLLKKSNGDLFEGWCWPGPSVYPDPTNPLYREWFGGLFKYDNYKGSSKDVQIWVDMNEPSVFSTAEVTLPRDVVHNGKWQHRDLHNVYGHLYHATVFDGLLRRSDGYYRPFVLSRSFFAGSQKYGAVWTGDNKADWDHLKASIPMLLSLSVSEIHFAGADIGGFFGHPSDELFIRWYQAALLWPFFRSHAHIDSPRREPWMFEIGTMEAIRKTLNARYTFLLYLYKSFFQSHTEARPIMRPLWFNFPEDENTFRMESEFMIGDALLMAPVLTQGQTTVDAYLPKSPSGDTIWYQIHSFQVYLGGKNYKVEDSLDELPSIFQLGGTIVPRSMRWRRSSKPLIADPITLLAALDNKNKSRGMIYLDDGDTTEHAKNDEYLTVDVELSHNHLKSKVTHAPKSLKIDNIIERIIIVGPADISFSSPLFSKATAQNEELMLEPLCIGHGTEAPHARGVVIRNPRFRIDSPFDVELL